MFISVLALHWLVHTNDEMTDSDTEIFKDDHFIRPNAHAAGSLMAQYSCWSVMCNVRGHLLAWSPHYRSQDSDTGSVAQLRGSVDSTQYTVHEGLTPALC